MLTTECDPSVYGRLLHERREPGLGLPRDIHSGTINERCLMAMMAGAQGCRVPGAGGGFLPFYAESEKRRLSGMGFTSRCMSRLSPWPRYAHRVLRSEKYVRRE